MTTLDDDTKLNELRGILSRALKHHTRLSTMFGDPASDVTSWADLELCLRKAVGMTDALLSLPAQAMGGLHPKWTENDGWEAHPQTLAEWDWEQDGPENEPKDRSRKRLSFSRDVDDPRAPDQMALVFRIDLSRVLGELTWRRAQVEMYQQKATALAPSQPAAVGERADALWEQLLPFMQVEECPPGDPYKDKVAALALIEAALRSTP